MTQYTLQLSDIKANIKDAEEAYTRNPNKATAELVRQCNSVLCSYQDILTAQADINYIASRIHDLDETAFQSVAEFSTEPDESIVKLCREFGL